MKYSVCTDALFNNIPTVEAMGKIKELGLEACEFWSWWDKDLDVIAAARRELDLHISAFCTRMVSLVNPSVRGEYISGLKDSIAAAKKCGVSMLITQTGNDIGASRARQLDNMTKTIRLCVPLLEAAGITLLVEPLNLLVDHSGYFLHTTEEAVELMDAVGSDRVKILFDIYHQQISEGNLTRNIMENIHLIGHFHAAGCPGRHELTSGEINYFNLLADIEAQSYKGYIGLEYFPAKDAERGLKSLPRFA